MLLSRLIDVINERFGTDENGTLQQAAAVNPEEKFSGVLNRVLELLIVDRMEQNEAIFARFMNMTHSRRRL